MEIVLADAQAVEDLRLLIKLSCGVSYVEDSGMRLPNSTRLRLAFLGNAFEFVDCVQECLQSLSEEDMTLADALSLLDEMPEELWEHEAALTIRIKIINVLVKERDEQAKRSEEGEEDENAEAAAVAAALTDKVSKALRQAGEALGKALGSVDK